MHIKDFIEKASIDDLFKIMPQVTTTLSFWGARRVQCAGYEGKAHIDSLAKRVMELARESKFEFTPQDRSKGKDIAKRIDRIYDASDLQVKQSNCFTRLFCFFQKWYFECQRPVIPGRDTSTIRWDWSDQFRSGFCKVFNYYTPRQFLEKYGTNPSQMEYVFKSCDFKFRSVHLAEGL